MNKHIRCWQNIADSSLLVKHLLVTSHSFEFNPEIPHVEKKDFKLDILEQL
jgi:hypothetical protein